MLLSPDPGSSTILGALTLFGIASGTFALVVHTQASTDVQLATYGGTGTFYPFEVTTPEWFWSGVSLTPIPDWLSSFFPNPASGAPLAALWSANYPTWKGAIVFGSMAAGNPASTAWNDIVIVPGPVTVENRQRCEGFLAHKGSRTDLLPADHPYKNAPPMQ
jgi:hypothetical protein